jgi:hypothetical protein
MEHKFGHGPKQNKQIAEFLRNTEGKAKIE